MTTAFDFLTVACFLGLVAAFALYTERDTRTLMPHADFGSGLRHCQSSRQ